VRPEFTLLSSHGLVLAALCRSGPALTLRQIGDAVGIRERAAFQLVDDLREAGFLIVHKIGRRNFYELVPHAPLMHPLLDDLTLGDLLGGILRGGVNKAVGEDATGTDEVLDLTDQDPVQLRRR
jgi:hypothetical protein